MKKIKVRIPVAVTDDGKWFAYGYHDCSDDDASSVIFDMANDAGEVVWRYVTAEIELPEAQEVAGEVEPTAEARMVE